MKDRFMNGFLAGVVANIPVFILDFSATLLKIDKLDFLHFVSILAFGDLKPDLWESIFSFFVQSMFAGIAGAILNYFIKSVTEKYYYVKSLIFGAMLWFSIYSVDIFFKIEDRVGIDFKTAVVHYLLSIIWGILAAWMIKWLEKNEFRKG